MERPVRLPSALTRLVVLASIIVVLGAIGAPIGAAAGPPFPPPVNGRAVYDNAGILSPATVSSAEATIDDIEVRTGAEVVVYTELVDDGVTSDETRARALALINQWGVGRKGFDDGLAIFFDIEPSRQHGQVQLYAAPGFEATYLTNTERQQIFDNDMLPHLRVADFDSALTAALARVSAAATPENARRLDVARQINAAIGLVGAPVAFLSLAFWAFYNWRRYGKDPVYLDDPSILMPAPPANLTAAAGAFVMDGGTSRRALTTAMLDLASRGELAFQQEDSGLFGMTHKVGIQIGPPSGDPTEEAQRERNARRPIGEPEHYVLRELRSLAPGGSLEPDDVPKFGPKVAGFDGLLETAVVAGGWMVEKPSKVMTRWALRGALPIGLGVVALIAGWNIPMSGLLLVGGGLILGGLAVVAVARFMPTVTMPGAMVRAMLAAYRRTLQKTMEQARSMQQVVDEAGLDWLETPDQAVVWGTALGLQHEIESVLSRSLEDVRADPSRAGSTYFPIWYVGSGGTSFASAAATGSGASLFSNSAVPDIGGMMSALGTIGNSPSSDGSGGGFGGGGGGGGGGGAGGGF